MTDDQYLAWLADLTAPRIVLCEMDHSQGTMYVASSAYLSGPGDTPPNQAYHDLLADAIDIETRIDGLISFGEISLIDDGEITHWIDLAWQGHEIRLFLGSPDWPVADFRLHVKGINGGITEARRGTIAFAIADQSAQLDDPIDTGLLPDNAGPVPLALGHVYNAKAVRTSWQTLEYTACWLPVTLLRPKDIGNPIPFTADLENGKFTLTYATPEGITVDIEESHNTPTLIIEWVAAHYALPIHEILMPDYTVGLYYASEVSGRQILDDLCAGMGAYWYLNALGELVVRQHQSPDTPELLLLPDDIDYGQIELVETQAPWTSLAFRWGRNQAVLSTVAGVIEDNYPALAARLKREWSESKAFLSQPEYPMAEEVVRDSCIATQKDAETELGRLLSLRSVRRDVWRIDAYLPLVEVGQTIAIDAVEPLSNGRTGRIISVSRSPTRELTTLEIWGSSRQELPPPDVTSPTDPTDPDPTDPTEPTPTEPTDPPQVPTDLHVVCIMIKQEQE